MTARPPPPRVAAAPRPRLPLVRALLAILAVLVNVAAPGLHRVAMAHAAAGGAEALVLCTGNGPVTVEAGPGDGSAPASAAFDDCCGLCVLAGAAVIATTPALAAPAARPAATPVVAASPAPRRAPTGPPLPARGPPHLS